MRSPTDHRRGFTLIELLVVLVALGLLLVIGLMLFGDVRTSASNRSAQGDVRAALVKATSGYVAHGNSYGADTVAAVAQMQGLDADGLAWTGVEGDLAEREVYVLLDHAGSGYSGPVGQQLTLCAQAANSGRVFCIRINQRQSFPVAGLAGHPSTQLVAASNVVYASGDDTSAATCALPQPGASLPDPWPADGCDGQLGWGGGPSGNGAEPEPPLPTNGELFMMGTNFSGVLGNGTLDPADELTPVLTSGVLADKSIAQLSAGNSFACALDSAGAAYCWGAGSGGKLGNDALASSSSPVAVTTSGVLAGKALTEIRSGISHTCALADDGNLYCWGSGSAGQMGNNTTTSNNRVPVAVDMSGALAGKTITDVAVGDGFSCVVADSAAYCWGAGANGRLGDGGTANVSAPTAVDASGVLAGKTVTAIAAGGSHACALADGAPYCWGAGSGGRLGNGASIASLVPVAVDTSGVLAGKTITAISGRAASQMCVIADGAPYCWGLGVDGQLGHGVAANALTPVAVDTSGVLAGKTVTDIDSGSVSTIVMTSDGGVYEWGNRAVSLVPVAVPMPDGWDNKHLVSVGIFNTYIGVIAANMP